MDLLEAKEIYHRDGYVLVPGVFFPEECAIIRHFANLQCIDLKHSANPSLQMHGTHPALLFWPQERCDIMRRAAHDIRMQAIVEYFLETKEVRQLNNQYYFREAGDGDQFAFHQDLCFRTPKEDFDDIENNYLQTAIIVDPMHEGNGAIEFVPGSHKLGWIPTLVPRDNSEKGLRKFVRGKWRGTKVTANPGDVLLWHSLTVHGSEKNESDSNRAYYMNGFATEKSVLNKRVFPKYAIKR